jgi:hypothetical protein
MFKILKRLYKNLRYPFIIINENCFIPRREIQGVRLINKKLIIYLKNRQQPLVLKDTEFYNDDFQSVLDCICCDDEK